MSKLEGWSPNEYGDILVLCSDFRISVSELNFSLYRSKTQVSNYASFTDISITETANSLDTSLVKQIEEDYKTFLTELRKVNDSLKFDLINGNILQMTQNTLTELTSNQLEEKNILLVLENIQKTQIEILEIESEILSKITSIVQPTTFLFDGVEVIAVPKSSIVHEGDTYEADLFLVATKFTDYEAFYDDNITLEMNKGKAKVKFKATHSGSFSNDKIEKSWKGGIIVPTPFGDTTFVKEFYYTVLKK